MLVVTGEELSPVLASDTKAVLKRLDLTKAKVKEIANAPLGPVNTASINADGSEVAIADQQTITIWHVAEGRVVRELAAENGHVGG